MIVLGLTGSIAMGKSTVGAMMHNMHIPVHEADACVHRLLKRNSPARPAIAAAFPFYEYPEIYDRKTKNIKRSTFGKMIFNDDLARKTLESILHPLVRKDQNEFIRQQTIKGLDMVCLDIPLLFETGADANIDHTITVSAPYNVQRARALSRPNMSEEKFDAILSRQMPDKEKCARSNYVIKNGLSRAHTLKSLKLIIKDIQKFHYGEGEMEIEAGEEKIAR